MAENKSEIIKERNDVSLIKLVKIIQMMMIL